MPTSRVLILVLLVACKKQAADPPKGTGSAAVAPGSGSVAPTGSGSAVVAAAADAAVDAAPDAPAAAASCLPRERVSFGRIGTELVACAGNAKCWTIDSQAKRVTERPPAPIPGVGFDVPRDKLTKPNCYQELCWPAVTKGKYANEDVSVALHPDGKRALVLDDPKLMVFDLAAKKITATFENLAGSTSQIWFANDLVMARGNDAGPHSVLKIHTAAGKELPEVDELFGGDVGLASDGRVIVQDSSLARVTILDGAKRNVLKRKAPKAPCDVNDPAIDSESDDPAVKKCIAFINKHYSPYTDAILIDDGADFIGFNGAQLFRLDAKLVETSRIDLPQCPKPPDEE